MINALIVYFVLVSMIGLLFMRHDKLQAINRKRRISERTLFTVAFIGGSVGVYFGMNLFRHKTKHRSFSLGIPCIILLQTVFIFFFSN